MEHFPQKRYKTEKYLIKVKVLHNHWIMFSDETQTKKLSDVPWQVNTFQLRRPRVCFSALTQELLSNAYEKVSRCSPTHIGLTGRR